MRILSATEAISPAIARTKLVLFKPFRPGRSWKLAATGYLGGLSTIFLPFPLIYLFAIPIVRRHGLPASMPAIIVAVVAAMLAIQMIVFYLGSRLRFAFFDIVLNRGQFVAPAWKKYGPQSTRWTFVKFGIGTVFFVLLAVPFAPLVSRMITTLSNIHFEQGQPPPPEFMQAIFAFYAGFFFIYTIVGIFALLCSLLSDFVVPSLALENTTLAEAFSRVGRLLRNEPFAVFIYALMKTVLFIAGGMAVSIFFYIFLFVVAIIAFILGLLVYFLLHLLHVPQEVISVLGILGAILLYLFVFFYGILLANGALYTILESYALYFLGGRYPILGDLLDRSTPPPDPMPLVPVSGYVPIAPIPPIAPTL